MKRTIDAMLPAFVVPTTRVLRRCALLIGAATAVLPVAALAQVAPVTAVDGFAVGAGVETQYDSNVARAPSSQGQGAWINEVMVGVGFDKTAGRHHVFGSADIGRVLYKQLSIYNHTHEDVRAGWHVDLPARSNAEIDVSRTLNLARFADLNSVRRDVISHNDARASVDFPVAGLWRLLAGGELGRTHNSNGVDSPADLNTNEVNGGVRYQTGSDNQIDLLARSVRGSYPNAVAATAVSPYRERAADIRMRWRFSGASTLFGHIGYLQRRNDLPAFPDFGGVAYDLTYLWQPTARSSLSALVMRETGANGDNQYLSSVTHRYRLTPAYNATSKIRIEAMAEMSQVDYLALAGTPSRSDREHGAGLNLAWTPRSWLQLRAGQTWEQRSSNLANFDYADRTSSLTVQASF